MSGVKMGRMSADDFQILSELTTSELEISTQIIEWGDWARGSMPGYTTAGSGPAPNISDDQGMAVDRIIAGMDGKTQYVLLQLYLYRQTMTAVGQSVVISNRRVAEYRDQGLNDLYGALKQLSRNSF